MTRPISNLIAPRLATMAASVIALVLWADRAIGQDDLLTSPPFDRIILDGADPNAALDVYPLDFPDRKVPSPKPQGDLTIRLMEQPERVYQVDWNRIQEIKLFEQLLLERAAELSAQQKFDEAFDLLARVQQEFPDTVGLDAGINDYLRGNALALFQQREFDRSLAVLGALYERNRKFPGLAVALDRVAGEIIMERLRGQDYAGAREVLDTLTSQFGDVAQTAIDNWQQRFREAADTMVAESRQYLRAGRFAEADRAARRATAIWPESTTAQQALREIQQRHPQVVVGVFEQAPRDPWWRIDCWPDLRVSQLIHPTLCQLEAFSTEGGVYRSPFGKLSVDDTERGQRLTLDVTDAAAAHDSAGNGTAAYALARRLLALADPAAATYRSDFAALCSAVGTDGNSGVHVDFRRPHVRPEAMLLAAAATAADDRLAPADSGSFKITDYSAGLTRLEVASIEAQPPGGILAVVERTFEDDRTAMAALKRGEVAMLDHVPPWQLANLRGPEAIAEGIKVGSYRLPTVHVLIPNPSNELLQRREFRRALCFGIDRQRILGDLICGGQEILGFEVISGPFPLGSSLNDPVRYAYDSKIEHRPYSPRLAATLSLVAATGLANARAEAAKDGEKPDSDADDSDEPAPWEIAKVPPLVLAHTSDALARVVCEAIQHGLRPLGIPIELRELTVDEIASGTAEYDLRYAELAVWEPVVDAHTIFGANGLVPGSAALRAGLRELELATNWVDVRKRLNEIHQIAHNDLPVIPLWQTVNHFAYRADVTGVGDSLITLYQQVGDWRLGAARGRP